MKKTVDTISASRQRKAKRRYFGAVLALTLCAALTCPALAAGSDPLTIVNNLSDFIFNIIKAVGVIHPVPWRQPAHPGLPVPVRRLDDRFCQGDFDRHRRDLTHPGAGRPACSLHYHILSKNASRIETHLGR